MDDVLISNCELRLISQPQTHHQPLVRAEEPPWRQGLLD